MKFKILLIIIIGTICTNKANAQIADSSSYLSPIIKEMQTQWPKNRTINIVFHGHSVPAGYANTPNVKSLDAYPHLLFYQLKEKYPYAVVNIITTAIGGENSVKGAKRFKKDVLPHHPDILFIDYSLNDRGIKLEEAEKSWDKMIKTAQAKGIKVILMTPTPDKRSEMLNPNDQLSKYAAQVRILASKYQCGLIDSYAVFCNYIKNGNDINEVMAWVNHPNKKGHEMVTREIMKWF